jgi:hypothetical protein
MFYANICVIKRHADAGYAYGTHKNTHTNKRMTTTILNAELFIIMTFYITMYNRIKGVLYRFVVFCCPEVEGGF